MLQRISRKSPLAGQHQGKNCGGLPRPWDLSTPSKGGCECRGEGWEAALTHWQGTKGSMVWSQEPLPSVQQAFEVCEYTDVGGLPGERDPIPSQTSLPEGPQAGIGDQAVLAGKSSPLTGRAQSK